MICPGTAGRRGSADVTSLNSASVFLSIVIPVFRCGPCLAPLYERLKTVLTGLAKPYEIVFVNDASPDESAVILDQLASADASVVVVNLPTNRGQFFAIAAGLAECRGDYAVVMDGDLEDPPEAIPRFLSEALSGYEIVLGVRSKRARPFLRWLASRLFRRLVAPYRFLPNHHDYGALSVLSRRTRQQFLSQNDAASAYLGILDRLGLPYKLVSYQSEQRPAGTSSYNWPTLLRVAHSIAGSSRAKRISSPGLARSAVGIGAESRD